MTAQRYVHDILQPYVLPLVQRLPGALFQQDNAWLTRVPQDCLRTVTVLPWPARSPYLFPIWHICANHLGRLWPSHSQRAFLLLVFLFLKTSLAGVISKFLLITSHLGIDEKTDPTVPGYCKSNSIFGMYIANNPEGRHPSTL
ncbi:transposable element Tcb2 transposase [Trichonephila clavipes]|nr:transposable element Tcb2 transposase [Trichonephila clavipes]